MPRGRTLLTIDCDWAVQPTALRESPHTPALPGEPEVTFEHVRYAYAVRPDDERHTVCCSPTELRARLQARGLSSTTQAAFSERHDGIRELGADVLADAEHIVCLDAHLDMYAVGSLAVGLAGPRGARLVVHYTPIYREMASGLESLPQLGDSVAAAARDATWEEAWALHLLEHMPILQKFTWVVPDHFAAGLAAGFPYPYARWMDTLSSGAEQGIWRYALDAPTRRIELVFLEAELAGRHLSVDVVTLDDCPSLADVDCAHLHVCRSPGFLHPGADEWVDELVTLLN